MKHVVWLHVNLANELKGTDVQCHNCLEVIVPVAFALFSIVLQNSSIEEIRYFVDHNRARTTGQAEFLKEKGFMTTPG